MRKKKKKTNRYRRKGNSCLVAAKGRDRRTPEKRGFDALRLAIGSSTPPSPNSRSVGLVRAEGPQSKATPKEACYQTQQYNFGL